MSKVKNNINPFSFGSKKDLSKNLSKMLPLRIPNSLEQFAWPELLPKNFKYKGKNYIHYAAEKKDLSMLDVAIKGKHKLSLNDKFGKNAIYYLFQESAVSNGELKLINVEFFNRILSADKKAWNASNTLDLFVYFKSKITSVIHHKKEIVYDEDKYEEVIASYRDCMSIIKRLNLKLELSYDQFKELRFNSSILGEVLEGALLVTKEKEEALEKLVKNINFFNTPIPVKIEPVKPASFITVLDEYGYYARQDDMMVINFMFGTTGNGKSTYIAQQMLKGYMIDENTDQETIYQMWKNHILKHNDLKTIVMSDKIFNLLQEYNHILSSKILQEELCNNLVNIKAERKRMKI